MIAGHVHNSRCSWLKTLGREHGIAVPASVDRRKVTRRELLLALGRSSIGSERSSRSASRQEATCLRRRPTFRATFAEHSPCPDVPVAHEGRHRGPIVMLARQLGHRLPAAFPVVCGSGTSGRGQRRASGPVMAADLADHGTTDYADHRPRITRINGLHRISEKTMVPDAEFQVRLATMAADNSSFLVVRLRGPLRQFSEPADARSIRFKL